MYAGKIVETSDRDSIYETPIHPYTETLLTAVPVPDPKIQKARKRIFYAGEVPNPLNPPVGCRFQSRCPYRSVRCFEEEPLIQEKNRTIGRPAGTGKLQQQAE
jgi:oligopeptide transport system ATP-binding protein